MKRKVLAVLLAASMMGTLGACGSSDSGKQTDAKTDDRAAVQRQQTAAKHLQTVPTDLLMALRSK